MSSRVHRGAHFPTSNSTQFSNLVPDGPAKGRGVHRSARRALLGISRLRDGATRPARAVEGQRLHQEHWGDRV
jgi:hypothetical protein